MHRNNISTSSSSFFVVAIFSEVRGVAFRTHGRQAENTTLARRDSFGYCLKHLPMTRAYQFLWCPDTKDDPGAAIVAFTQRYSSER